MARVKIELPETFHSEFPVRVRIGDINYGQHLSNDAVLRMMHDVRCRFYDSVGYSELDIGGAGTIMSGVSIRYVSEAFFNDEMTCKIAVDDISSTGFDLIYCFTRLKDNKDIAHAVCNIVFFDYEHKKVVRSPEDFLKKFAE